MRALTQVVLVTGGVRSGKSRVAEERLSRFPGPRTYLATAEAGDAEMAERIARHRISRGDGWRTVEEPLELVRALAEGSGPVLVDCLTLWLSNLLHAGRDWELEAEALMHALPRLGRTVVLVSNEVGMGIVPDTPLGRAFRDAAGLLNQAVAAAADEAVLVVAGLPLVLKSSPP